MYFRNPSHCNKVIQGNGHHVILQAMKIHNMEAGVQVREGCLTGF